MKYNVTIHFRHRHTAPDMISIERVAQAWRGALVAWSVDAHGRVAAMIQVDSETDAAELAACFRRQGANAMYLPVGVSP